MSQILHTMYIFLL